MIPIYEISMRPARQKLQAHHSLKQEAVCTSSV